MLSSKSLYIVLYISIIIVYINTWHNSPVNKYGGNCLCIYLKYLFYSCTFNISSTFSSLHFVKSGSIYELYLFKVIIRKTFFWMLVILFL